MKQWEYEALQDALTKKSENNPLWSYWKFQA